MKTALWFGATWAGSGACCFFAIVFSAIVAGRGMSAGSTAVMLLVPLEILLFLAGSVVFWMKAAGTPNRWLFVGLQVGLGMGTALFFAFVTALAFNR